MKQQQYIMQVLCKRFGDERLPWSSRRYFINANKLLKAYREIVDGVIIYIDQAKITGKKRDELIRLLKSEYPLCKEGK
jgi:hypothetical protein